MNAGRYRRTNSERSVRQDRVDDLGAGFRNAVPRAITVLCVPRLTSSKRLSKMRGLLPMLKSRQNFLGQRRAVAHTVHPSPAAFFKNTRLSASRASMSISKKYECQVL